MTVPKQGFGKRGQVQMPSAQKSTPPPPSKDEGQLSIPKWAIGAVAAAFLFLLVSSTGGVGGGGLLGGLLGGLIANKMMNSNTNQKVATRSAPVTAAPSQTGATASRNMDVSRGGFGSTGSSSGSSWSFGG